MTDDLSAHITDAELADEPEPAAFEETVDGVPVLEDERSLAPAAGPAAPVQPLPRSGALASVASPAVQAAAAAATGFVAGAATLALVRRHSARKQARAIVRPRRAAEALPILSSRSFLVDVHLIGKPGE